MGNLLTACTSCCKESGSYEDLTPDEQTRRQQQMEAAERRMREQEQRGIGNVNAVKRQQQQALEREKREQELANTDRDAPLKWQVN
ncbi:reticulocyte-binding protein homolog 2a [Microplitis mediator]|uniref:reticulocyte-binding protein homolog 2a n=1 Tax=Microplitis mediator TaxID=375433 RepID=UPI0025560768|nr:reticulocyte-binding protein homolog 2a [Microplitis mediator]